MAFWIVWLIIGSVFIVAFTAAIVPKIIFRLYASVIPVKLHVDERFTDGYGQTVACTPSAEVQKYIKSYRVGTKADGLYFRGEWAKCAACVEYNLTAYDANDEIIDIIAVKEKFNGGKYTADIALPQGTDYVTVRIVCVDDTPEIEGRRKLSAKFFIWLATLSLYFALACDVLLWLVTTCILRCLEFIDGAIYDISVGNWVAILAVVAICVMAVTAAICSFLLLIGKKEEDNDG